MGWRPNHRRPGAPPDETEWGAERPKEETNGKNERKLTGEADLI